MYDTRPISQFIGDDEEDDKLLKEMAEEAKNWLLKKNICSEVKDIHFGEGVGGIFASFLFKIQTDSEDREKFIWVVCGDIPTHYFDIDDERIRDGEQAIMHYSELLVGWIEGVRSKKPFECEVDVGVPPTIEWTNNLTKRLNFIAKYFMGELN